MGKRNYKAGMPKRPDEVKRPGQGSKKVAAKGSVNGKAALKGSANSKPAVKSAAASRSAARRPGSAPITVQTVRIVGAAIALLAVAGAVAWGVSVKGVFSPATIAGLIVLGLAAIIAIFGVVRAEQVLARTLPMVRRRG